jgi:geranylgeranyl pyrophosphate synthase
MADDLEDKSVSRRGQPCTYIKYGVDYAVNAATLMYYSPIVQMEKFIQDQSKYIPLMKLYHDEMISIHMGQNWDIHWHNGKVMPSE